jgi:hypothetical protein
MAPAAVAGIETGRAVRQHPRPFGHTLMGVCSMSSVARILTVRAGQVFHNPAGNTYTTEASTVGLPPGVPPPVLIALLDRPGLELFCLEGEDRHHVGEGISAWHYQGAGKSRLLLIND